MKIDAKGLTCPKPLVLALEALPKLAAGETLAIEVDDEVAVQNLTRMAQEKKLELETKVDGAITVLSMKGDAAIEVSDAEKEADELCEIPAVKTPGAELILVSADHMGRGNEELGKILIKGFIYALAHQEKIPTTCVFYNGGASLTCEGSELLEDIKTLEDRGCKVMTCGTCLDFLGIRENLAVGGVTNLYEIAELVSTKTSFQI